MSSRLKRPLGRALAVSVSSLALALSGLVHMSSSPAQADQSLPPTELLGDSGPVMPLKDKARIIQSKWGYRFIAGQQDSHITITPVDDGLLYTDTGTKKWRDLAPGCTKRKADKGIAAWCALPKKYRGDTTMFLEVWPRLGNDFVDGSTLPAKYRLWTLADAGNDEVHGGAGDDFTNGAQNNDVVYGNDGNDWLRGGIGTDSLFGGDGADKLVGQDGKDRLDGGDGADRLYGSTGGDRIWAGAGKDQVDCSSGKDSAYVERQDRHRGCEQVHQE